MKKNDIEYCTCKDPLHCGNWHEYKEKFSSPPTERGALREQLRRALFIDNTEDCIDAILKILASERTALLGEMLNIIGEDDEISVEMALGKHGKEFQLIEMTKNKLRAELRQKVKDL